MSIKFPDFQVLVTRTDQIPRTNREGDQSGAGKVIPQVTNEFATRPKRITETPKEEYVRLRKDRRQQKQQDNKEKESGSKNHTKKRHKRRIDIRA